MPDPLPSSQLGGFSPSPPLLEALNLGNVDLSADVADTVPVFAQAAGAQLTYFAQEAPSPAAQAIIVREDSPICPWIDATETSEITSILCWEPEASCHCVIQR